MINAKKERNEIKNNDKKIHKTYNRQCRIIVSKQTMAHNAYKQAMAHNSELGSN